MNHCRVLTTPLSSFSHDICDISNLDHNIPVLITSVHSGGYVSQPIEKIILIPQQERFKEEDPYTDRFIDIGGVGVTCKYSRFEFDLNRPKERTVYRGPAEAWGLTPWSSEDDYQHALDIGQRKHDEFYKIIRELIELLGMRHQKLLHLNLHSFNHRRLDDPAICISTEIIPEIWNDSVVRFMTALRKAAQDTRTTGTFFRNWRLDDSIKENYPFGGGYLSQWISNEFRQSTCSIQIEFNKSTFMTEDGAVIENHLGSLKKILEIATYSVLESWQV
jgi:N-formylglutamate deformylase